MTNKEAELLEIIIKATLGEKIIEQKKTIKKLEKEIVKLKETQEILTLIISDKIQD